MPARGLIAVGVGVGLIAAGGGFMTASIATAATPAPSYGYVAAGRSTFDQLTTLTAGQVGTGPALTTTSVATASAITPDGTSAIFADYAAELLQTEGLNTVTPTTGPPIDLTSYAAEGGATYKPFSTAVSLTNTFGLAALDSQGLLQLRRVNGVWEVDSRVQSPGVNEVGQPHQPGWIRFGATGQTSVYDSVVLSNVPLPNGKYIALSTDRGSAKGVISVVEGVGTAKPRLVGRLRSQELRRVEPSIDDTGTGGIAFSPATATRAVVATSSGFLTVDLRKPSHPRFLASTAAGKPGQTTAVAVAPDGNHVAVASADKVRIFKGLIHTSGSLPAVGNVVPAPAVPTSTVQSMGYLLDGRLVLERLGVDAATSDPASFATVLARADTNAPKVGTSVELSGQPTYANSMSLTPAVAQPVIVANPDRIKAGEPASIKLKAHDGIGTYQFTITAGSLPKGLSMDGDMITGTPKHPGTRTFAVRARNQYDGTVFGSVTLTVH